VSFLANLTIELTCVRRLAQPAGERQVERRVRAHFACSVMGKLVELGLGLAGFEVNGSREEHRRVE
jgi:hypothetical protein